MLQRNTWQLINQRTLQPALRRHSERRRYVWIYYLCESSLISNVCPSLSPGGGRICWIQLQRYYTINKTLRLEGVAWTQEVKATNALALIKAFRICCWKVFHHIMEWCSNKCKHAVVAVKKDFIEKSDPVLFTQLSSPWYSTCCSQPLRCCCAELLPYTFCVLITICRKKC